MLLSEYIQHLQAIMQEHGDMNVKQYAEHNAAIVINAKAPTLQNMQKLIGNQSIPRYWGIFEKDENLKGEKVCAL